MPLIKSTSKQALGQNIATEVRAGRPVKQAAAIAYSEQRAAESKQKHRPAEHHSAHSAQRSAHYHQHVAGPIVPSHVLGGPSKMTRAEHQLDNQEDSTSRFSMTNRARKP